MSPDSLTASDARRSMVTSPSPRSAAAGMACPKIFSTASIISTDSSESPPRSKKSSVMPIGATSRSSSHSSQSLNCTRLTGSTTGPRFGRAGSGRGSASRSTLPLALSGRRSSLDEP